MSAPGREGMYDARRASRTSKRIGRLYLSGMNPELQGAVLADLVATWLAGHMLLPILPNDGEDAARAATAMRKEMFDTWGELVFQLIPLCENEIRERYGLAPNLKEKVDASKRSDGHAGPDRPPAEG